VEGARVGRRSKKIDEMYSFYCEGNSLQSVGKKFGVTRQSVYGLFAYNGRKMRGKVPPLPFVEFMGEKYTLRNMGYYGRTSGGRTLLHRDVWEHHHGKIPLGFDVHHKSCDPLDNSIENLECLSKSEHTRLYSPHNNQYTKGNKKG
jgi:hypothetical protein